MKVAFFQMDIVWENPTWNLDKVAQWVRGLDTEVDLVILPEMFASGFCMDSERIAQPMDGQIVTYMQDLSVQTGKAIIFDAAIKATDRAEKEKIYNRLIFVAPDNTRLVYDKHHLFRMAGEQNHYDAGDQQLIIHYKGFKIMPLICYDLRFPIWSRKASECDLLIYVASWGESRRYAWDTLLRARAIENQCYVVGVNRVGDDPKEHYCGSSVALDFFGKPIAQADDDLECGVCAELDKEKLDQFRKSFPAAMDADKYTINLDL